MSNSQVVIPTASAVMRLNEPIIRQAQIPPGTVSYEEIAASSFSNSQIVFGVANRTDNSILQRVFYVEYTVDVTLSSAVGDPSGAVLARYGDGNTALRAYPLQQSCTSAALSLGKITMTTEPRDIINLIAAQTTDDDRETSGSICPSLPDNVAEYVDYASLGDAGNVLSKYLTNTSGTSRGAFTDVTVLSETNTQVVWRLHVLEPLLAINPLIGDLQSSRTKGLVFTEQVALRMTLDGNLQRMLSHNNTNLNGSTVIDNVTVAFFGAPKLHFISLTPPASLPIGVSKKIRYKFTAWNVQRSNSALLLGNAKGQKFQYNNLQVNTMPNAFMIYVERTQETKTAFTTDTYARITNVRIKVGDQPQLLTEADEHNLYNISVGNGLNLGSFNTVKHTGLPLIVTIADMGGPPWLIPGASVRQALNFEVTVDSTTPNDMQANMVVVSLSTSELVATEGPWVTVDNSLPERALDNIFSGVISAAGREVGGGTMFGLGCDCSEASRLTGRGFFSSIGDALGNFTSGVANFGLGLAQDAAAAAILGLGSRRTGRGIPAGAGIVAGGAERFQVPYDPRLSGGGGKRRRRVQSALIDPLIVTGGKRQSKEQLQGKLNDFLEGDSTMRDE